MNNYNYPMGADADPRAPWHDPGEQEPRTLQVTVSQSIHKDTTVEVKDYVATEWDEAEYDEEGHICHYGGVDYDYSDCNIRQAFDDQEWAVEEIFQATIELYKSIEKECSSALPSKYFNRLKAIAKACEGWETDETEVIRNE